MNVKYVVLAILFFSFAEAKQHILKIDDVVKMALKHSPDIQGERLDFKGAEQRIKAAKGFYLPRLDLTANTGKQWSKLKHQSYQNTNVLSGGLGASQLLYDFGKTAGKIAGSTQESYALRSQMQQTISDKIFFLKKSYYSILKIKGIIDVQHKNVKLQKQQLYRAKKYLESGIKTIIDVTDAQVRVEQAKLDLQNAQYELELQRASLEESMGVVPYKGNYRLYSKKLALGKLSKKLPLISTPLKRLESFAYKHRHILQSSKHFVKGAVSNVNVSKSDYYPTISLSGNYNVQHVDKAAVAISPQSQGQLGVNMSWNLFSGYQTDASVEEAKLGVLKATSQVQSVKLAIKNQVIQSYINIRKSKDNVKLYESISKASYKKFEQAQKRYENELSDYVELQDAQQGYIKALSDSVNAYYDYYIAIAQLDHAIGK